jgi:hypothetical protein
VQTFAVGAEPNPQVSEICDKIADVYKSNSSRSSLSDSLLACPGEKRDAILIAKALMVGVSRKAASERLTPNASPIRTAARAASREWPPTRKN